MKNKLLLVIIGVICLLLLLGGGYYAYTNLPTLFGGESSYKLSVTRTEIKAGDELELKVFDKNNKEVTENVEFVSNNLEIVLVDGRTIKGISGGYADIIVSVNGNVIGTCRVIV